MTIQGRPGIVSGLFVAAMLTAAQIGIFFFAWRVAGLPFMPFDIFDWETRVLPGRLIAFGIGTMVAMIRGLNLGPTSTTAKTAEQAMAIAGLFIVGVVAGFIVFLILRTALPIVVTTTARDSMWGPTIPELVEALPGMEIIDRSSVNAYDDARVARAIEATGREKLIFAGLLLTAVMAGKGIRRVRACRRVRNFQRDQAPSRDFTNGPSRSSGFGLLHIDGGDSQGQSRARSGPRL